MFAKARIKRSFSHSSITYDQAAALQRRAGLALLEFLGPLPPESVVMDLGCGTGFISAELCRNPFIQASRLIAVDLALPMVLAARGKLNNRQVEYICADAEKLPLGLQSVDVIISNLALQWCLDTGVTIESLWRTLRPGGILAFTTFGPRTLVELKAAWKQLDDYPHVNDFIGMENLLAYLQAAGFAEVKYKIDSHAVGYESVIALMRELKELGAQTVTSGVSRSLTGKNKIRKLADVYPKTCGNTKIESTYEVFTFVAKK